MITYDYAKIYQIVGRSKEVGLIHEDLLGKKVSVIQLSGDIGVGKTALANRIIEMESSGAFARRFDQHIVQTAYQEPWTRVVSQLAKGLIGRSIIFKATKEEIENRILTYCTQKAALLVIDNIEEEHHVDVCNFINLWLEQTHKSVLLITLRKEVPINGEKTRNYEIVGLSEDYPQLELLGDKLRQRFGDDLLLKSTTVLDGIPLNLLYLQYLDPKSEEDLKKHVIGLTEETIEKLSVLKLSAIEDVLASFHRRPTHYMALAVILNLQFDERLLAYLWDVMGGGSSETYIELREKLVSSHLLIPVSDPKRRTYRINEDIHRQLYRALSNRIGGEKRVSTVHFFVSEYYRRVFETRETYSLEALDSFIYHSFASGEFDRAYSYLFDSDILPALHQAGMALQLENLLQSLIDKEGNFSQLQRCQILIQMAHVCNDLSQFDKCLELTDRAVSLLQSVKNKVDSSTYAHLSKRIWYYSAVAYSNTGRSQQCLKSYFNIITTAWDDDPNLDSLACLSLGYLAHDLKYHDIDKSLKYGRLALEIARDIDDAHLIAKNLCTLAETHIYSREFEEAEICFKEAIEHSKIEKAGSADRRELGRILKNLGLIALVQKEWEVCKERLTKARELSDSMGDRRRIATADLYLGILYWHLENQEKAEKLLISAINALNDLRDGRYLVPALMTYVWWKNPKYTGQLHKLKDCKNCDESLKPILIKASKEDRFEIYATFWRNCFRPTIFDSRDQ